MAIPTLQPDYSEEDQKLKDAVVDVGRQFGICLVKTGFAVNKSKHVTNSPAEVAELAVASWACLAGMICDVIYEFGGDE